MTGNSPTLAISSPDLEDGHRFDDRFTAYGANETPRIEVHGVPGDTVELALIVHDPDAPLPLGYTHWICYGIPARDGELGVDLPFRVAPNDTGRAEWYGPRPPAGHGVHRYYFWLYALDTTVEGSPGRTEFLSTYGANVIGQARLVGTYSRQ